MEDDVGQERTMTGMKTFYCPECGRPLSGVPGTQARCAQCSRVVNLPAVGAIQTEPNQTASKPNQAVSKPPRRHGLGLIVVAVLLMFGLLSFFWLGAAHMQRSTGWESAGTTFGPAISQGSSSSPQERLETIWVAIQRYEIRHGAWPENLAILVREGDIESDVLADPRMGDTPAQGPTLEMMAAQVNAPGHLSFVYLHPANPHGVLVFERPTSVQTQIWALYGDGRIGQVPVGGVNR